jgi:hypothetical protein
MPRKLEDFQKIQNMSMAKRSQYIASSTRPVAREPTVPRFPARVLSLMYAYQDRKRTSETASYKTQFLEEMAASLRFAQHALDVALLSGKIDADASPAVIDPANTTPQKSRVVPFQTEPTSDLSERQKSREFMPKTAAMRRSELPASPERSKSPQQSRTFVKSQPKAGETSRRNNSPQQGRTASGVFVGAIPPVNTSDSVAKSPARNQIKPRNLEPERPAACFGVGSRSFSKSHTSQRGIVV